MVSTGGLRGESLRHLLVCKDEKMVALRARTLDLLFSSDVSLSAASTARREQYLLGSWSPGEPTPRHCSPEFLQHFTPFVRGFLRLRAHILDPSKFSAQEGDVSSQSPSLDMALGSQPQDSEPFLE